MTLLFFHLPWNHACGLMEAQVKSAAAYHGIPIDYIDCDLSQSRRLIEIYDVTELPTLILIDNGIELYRTCGPKNYHTLIKEISNNK